MKVIYRHLGDIILVQENILNIGIGDKITNDYFDEKGLFKKNQDFIVEEIEINEQIIEAKMMLDIYS